MDIKTVLRKALGVVLFCVLTVSITWTILSAIGIARARGRAAAEPSAEINISVHEGILLPKFDTDASLAGLANGLLSFARAEVHETGGDSVATVNLMNASISFDAADSTYSYRFAFVSECGCPLAMTDRYTVDLKYMNPRTLKVFREERHRNLSAEDVKRFDELLAFEGR
ncbi:MAG: hypothetical protein NTW97_03810 [Candidatus Krumholzibacteria bacterium]|nr:hypothetical protein [Candidatus Krumholzibacteria bacterium]